MIEEEWLSSGRYKEKEAMSTTNSMGLTMYLEMFPLLMLVCVWGGAGAPSALEYQLQMMPILGKEKLEIFQMKQHQKRFLSYSWVIWPQRKSHSS